MYSCADRLRAVELHINLASGLRRVFASWAIPPSLRRPWLSRHPSTIF